MFRRIAVALAPAAGAFALAAAPACTPPPRMCAAEGDCGAHGACVAGRCVAQGATAAIDNARRLLFSPVDQAYVRRNAVGGGGNGNGNGSATVATLGRASDGGALALLRFDARLPPEATVLEAYLLLERATDVDADPATIAVHAVPIREAWDSRSVSWATAPRTEELGAGAPVTRVFPAAGAFVRLDVREIVAAWRRRGRAEFGVAVQAEGVTPTGVSFVWAPRGSAPAGRDALELARGELLLSEEPGPGLEAPSPFEPRPAVPSTVGEPRREPVGPRLELYVR